MVQSYQRTSHTSAVLLTVGVFCCLSALPASAYDVEPNVGLRAARRVDARTIELHLGPGFAPGNLGGRLPAFQIVSPTDPRFQKGIQADAVKLVETRPDVTPPPGYAGPTFDRHRLAVRLPKNATMRGGHRYWIRIVSPNLVAKNTAAVWIEPKAPAKQALRSEYGLRLLKPMTPTILHVVTGPGVDVAKLVRLVVSSPDDPAYAKPVHPKAVHRRSSLDFYIPRGWPWKYRQRHDLFLELPTPLTESKTYRVDLNAKAPVTCGNAVATLTLDRRKTTNTAIKVNQAGYLPNAKKYAYVGQWMGDGNAADFSGVETVELWRPGGDKPLRTFPLTLRSKAACQNVDGKQVPAGKNVGRETVYKQDLSFEDVYEVDLSDLTTPGEYFLAAPAIGRSFTFRIADDAYRTPFETLMHGLFIQRCGIELKPPYSDHYRPACHRNNTHLGQQPSSARHDAKLESYPYDKKKVDMPGGHHDAGDWDPRSHLSVAEWLMLLYELRPGAFRDGQLNIPEKANGVPDVLDEAAWALLLWNHLQEADGGVRSKVETAGDPREYDTAATDRNIEFAFRKEAGATYRYAAAAAQATRLYAGIGKKAVADDYLTRARRAWTWAETHRTDADNDARALAAAQLLRTTGEKPFADAFAEVSVFSKNPSAALAVHNKHDQRLASFHYAQADKADAELKKHIVAAFEADARHWLRWAKTTHYRYARSVYAPNTWGTGGLPKWAPELALAMAATPDKALRDEIRQWLLYTNDFSLGCHPMNLVFTTSLGQRSVTGPWHHLNDYTPGEIAGLQTEAAGGRWDAGQPASRNMSLWPAMSLYPAGPWPDLYKYSEKASPGMNEGVTVNQVRTAFAYGLFLPEARPSPR